MNTQTVAADIQALTPPRIGEYWHGQGGIFVGTINHQAAGQQWHLVLAVAQNKFAWGSEYEEIAGADDYWDGAANTKAMLATDKCPAAVWAAFLKADGHQDFYIPAQRELNLICINASHLAEKAWHWSSTQYSAYDAWLQNFEYGTQSIYYKDYTLAVRAVRRVLAI